MKKRILLGIVMIEMCGILGCFYVYPFYVRKEIKGDYIEIGYHNVPHYTDKIESNLDIQYFYFAESKELLQNAEYKYDPMDPNRHYIFIGDSVKVLSIIPVKPKIKRVKIEGTTYIRYRYRNKFTGGMEGPLDIYVRNKIIKFMYVERFNE